MSYTTLDIETTTRTKNKRKANPWGAGNWIVVYGFKKQGGQVRMNYTGAKPPPAGWLREVLQGTKLLIGFNIKFDIQHAIEDAENYEAWMEWVAGGGQLWDCQLAEYLLNGMGQRDHMLSLDEVAPRYGGNVKVDEVKALWAAGIETHEIEPTLLMRYLGGGPDETGQFQLGDVENTERVALAQIKRARECGQLKSCMLNMGSLIFTIEAEKNGMFVDMPRGLEIAKELEVAIAQLQQELQAFVPTDLPFPFKWTSRHHKSALIFGGALRYDRREWQLADGTWTFEPPPAVGISDRYCYAQKDETHYVLEDGSTMSAEAWDAAWAAGGFVKLTEPHPLGHTDEDGTHYGPLTARAVFKGGKNAGEPKTKKVKVPDATRPKTRMGEDRFALPGFTTPSKAWATEDPGVFKVNDDVIEELGTRNIPFLKTLSKLQSLVKDLGTYYLTVDPESGERKGMLSLVDEVTALIHHRINHTSTVTGRFSASDPNLQNLPKGNKSKVKSILSSRFGAKGKIVQSDFSSLEVYIQAILTGCRQLIADLKAGLDMHVKRLASKEGMTYDEVLLLCKGDEKRGIEPVEEWDYKRIGAKVFSFQRAYGAGVAKIAATTGMSVEDVAALVEADDAMYPEVPAYYEDLTTTIKANRVPTGRSVPHPDVPGIVCHLGESSYRTPDGKLYLYSEHPAPEFLILDKKGRRRHDAVFASFSPTEIKNYVVQGEGAEWMKAAMWLSVRAFYARRNFGGKALIVNTVHDAAYLDAHEAVAFEAAALLHACMEAASDFMEWYFGWRIPVPVPSDTTWGLSMIEEQKIPGLKDRAATLRTELRNTYMNGYTPSYLH